MTVDGCLQVCLLCKLRLLNYTTVIHLALLIFTVLDRDVSTTRYVKAYMSTDSETVIRLASTPFLDSLVYTM